MPCVQGLWGNLVSVMDGSPVEFLAEFLNLVAKMATVQFERTLPQLMLSELRTDTAGQFGPVLDCVLRQHSKRRKKRPHVRQV